MQLRITIPILVEFENGAQAQVGGSTSLGSSIQRSVAPHDQAARIGAIRRSSETVKGGVAAPIFVELEDLVTAVFRRVCSI